MVRGWCDTVKGGPNVSRRWVAQRRMCACARHIFYTFLLITPECDTPRSRAAGCTLNEKSQILHFILLKLPAIWKSLIPLTISVKLMPVPISSDVYLNDEI